MKRTRHMRWALCMTACIILLSGCPLRDEADVMEAGSLSLIVSSSETDPMSVSLSLDGEAVEAVMVTVEAVYLEQGDRTFTLFAGPRTVDLLGVQGLPELLTNTAVESGVYDRAVVVMSDADVWIRGGVFSAALPEEGAIDVPGPMVVGCGDQGVLSVDVVSLLFHDGPGGDLLLVPEFGLSGGASSILVSTMGCITSVDTCRGFVSLATATGDILTSVPAGTVFHSGDAGVPTGTVRDLMLGETVQVIGELTPEGSVRADLVTLSQDAASKAGRGGQGKVLMCHKPRGNAEAAHEIEVAQAAVAAHLAHGDTLGPCEDVGEGEGEGEGEGKEPVGDISLSMDTLDYGPYPVSGGQTTYQSVTVYNVGDADLSILARFLEGPNSTEFRIVYDTGQSLIATGGERVISVTFDLPLKVTSKHT